MQTDIQSLPLSGFTRWQVAEILGVSIATVNLYTTRGKRISNDLYIKLPKAGSRYEKHDLIAFMDKLKSI